MARKKKAPGKKAPAPGIARSRARETGPEEAEEVLTLKEAANYLGVSPEDVILLVQEKNLPGISIGTEWRFLKSALGDWRQKHGP